MVLPHAWRELNQNRRDILLVVALREDVTAGEIGAALDIDHASTVHRGLEQLRSLGYVDTEQTDGGRGGVKENNVSDHGSELLGEVAATWYDVSVQVAP